MTNNPWRKLSSLLAITLALLLALLGSRSRAAPGATTRYVAPGGACGSAAPCYATVQAAVDAAASGDQILIAAGVYTPTLYVDKTVTLRGGYAPPDWTTSRPEENVTLLDGQTGDGILITGGSPALDGLHVSGHGFGIYATAASPTLSRLVVTGPGDSTGIYLADCDALLSNVVVSGWEVGVSTAGSTSTTLQYVTIVGNDIGLYLHGNSQAVVRNTIVAAETVGLLNLSPLTLTVTDVLWHGNGTNYGSFAGPVVVSRQHSGDPRFATDGYHIGFASAAIDQAADTGVSTDLDGDARPVGPGWDLGADECTTVQYRCYLPLLMRDYAARLHLVDDAPDECPGLEVAVGAARYRDDFDHPNDNDRYRFAAQAGLTYTVSAFDLGPQADTVLELYGPDCATLLLTNDDCLPDDPASGSCLTFQPDADGEYNILLHNYDWSLYGPGSEYTLQVEEER